MPALAKLVMATVAEFPNVQTVSAEIRHAA